MKGNYRDISQFLQKGLSPLAKNAHKTQCSFYQPRGAYGHAELSRSKKRKGSLCFLVQSALRIVFSVGLLLTSSGLLCVFEKNGLEKSKQTHKSQ